MAAQKLTLDDIADTRAYERERDEFRARVIDLKKRRRIGIGPIVTVVFENRDTIRFQIQEMARVERIVTDEGIQTELDIYNPLIPEPGRLSATLFLELTSKDELLEWLPKLVGIERSMQLRLRDGTVVPCTPESGHEAQLTREDTTASVHYIHFLLTPEQVEGFAAGGVAIEVAHDHYEHSTPLSQASVEELLGDLRG
jgi:hypothetical protein